MGIIWAKQLQHTGCGLDDFFAKCFNGLLALRGEGDNDLPVVQGVGQTGDEALFLHAVEQGGDAGRADHHVAAQVRGMGLAVVGQQVVQDEVFPPAEFAEKVLSGLVEQGFVDLY